MRMGWSEGEYVLLSVEGNLNRTPQAAIGVDSELVGHEIVSKALRWLKEHRCQGSVVPIDKGSGISDLKEIGQMFEPNDLVVAIGGGALLDRVKLATLSYESEKTLHHLEIRQRSGMVMIPAEVRRSRALIAIPTTLGTGSEVSSVAVLTEGERRRLVMGHSLKPEAAVIDPVSTGGLPVRLAREGVFEILSRLVAPYVSEHTEKGGLADELVETAVHRLMRLSGALLEESRPSPEIRGEIALIGSFAHSDSLVRPHGPWESKLWFVANELSSVAGVRKMVATLVVWPCIWRRILQGDNRRGEAVRLRRIWSVISDGYQGLLTPDPARGIAQLIKDFDLAYEVRLSLEGDAKVVDQVVRAWGGGLPMMGVIDPRELTGLIEEVTRPVSELCGGLMSSDSLPRRV